MIMYYVYRSNKFLDEYTEKKLVSYIILIVLWV
jgi:hypothetical protein